MPLCGSWEIMTRGLAYASLRISMPEVDIHAQ